MIAQGMNFMFIGMTVVFVFLSVLVIIMNIAAAFFKKFDKYFPEETVAAKTPAASSSDADIAVAIAAVKNFVS